MLLFYFYFCNSAIQFYLYRLYLVLLPLLPSSFSYPITYAVITWSPTCVWASFSFCCLSCRQYIKHPALFQSKLRANGWRAKVNRLNGQVTSFFLLFSPINNRRFSEISDKHCSHFWPFECFPLFYFSVWTVFFLFFFSSSSQQQVTLERLQSKEFDSTDKEKKT